MLVKFDGNSTSMSQHQVISKMRHGGRIKHHSVEHCIYNFNELLEGTPIDTGGRE